MVRTAILLINGIFIKSGSIPSIKKGFDRQFWLLESVILNQEFGADFLDRFGPFDHLRANLRRLMNELQEEQSKQLGNKDKWSRFLNLLGHLLDILDSCGNSTLGDYLRRLVTRLAKERQR